MELSHVYNIIITRSIRNVVGVDRVASLDKPKSKRIVIDNAVAHYAINYHTGKVQ